MEGSGGRSYLVYILDHFREDLIFELLGLHGNFSLKVFIVLDVIGEIGALE